MRSRENWKGRRRLMMKAKIQRKLIFTVMIVTVSVVSATIALTGGSFAEAMLPAIIGGIAASTAALYTAGDMLKDVDDLIDKQQKAQKQWIVDTSHELRTPISILRAQIEALQDGVQTVTPRTLSVLHGEVMALGKLVTDLHQLARSDLGELRLSLQSVDLLPVLRDTVDAFGERFREKNITVEIAGSENDAFVIQADSARLRQLFSNLLENSLRYTRTGGELLISYKLDRDSILLRFDDSEPGVHEEYLPHLFERFFRGEQSRSRSLGGSGLGLAISRAIVEAHTGNISAHKSPLKGLRIEVFLPAKEEIPDA